MLPHILVFSETSLDEREVNMQTFGRFVDSSKNVPTSVGICPGTLISHLGIIRTTPNPQQYIRKQENTKSPKMFTVFWAL